MIAASFEPFRFPAGFGPIVHIQQEIDLPLSSHKRRQTLFGVYIRDIQAGSWISGNRRSPT